MIKILMAEEAGEMLKKRIAKRNRELEESVAGIIEEVIKGGDGALCDLSLRLDGCGLTPEKIRVSEEEIEMALKEADRDFLREIKSARDNIKAYHEKQLQNSWFDCAREGVMLGQLITPLDRVGIYVPGGKASYPSSVLMNAVPAKVAGVREIAMFTPPGNDGRVNVNTLAAAAVAGVAEIYRIGGAQAVAAMAYGTETIRPVDKITGPGNRYVTAAKRLVFGTVGIDMLAGPSEILVIADSSANPAFVAADLLSQAEHDEMAAVVLITPDRELAGLVGEEIERQLRIIGRSGIAAKAVADYGAIVIAGSLEEAVELANGFAPEHLELAVSDPFSWLGKIRSAGAVFLGHFTPEPVGDYVAGPNHVLPTGGTARFSSPLGVDQFVRRTSVISYSRSALEREAPGIIMMATVEGLDAHAASVEIRIKKGLPELKKREKYQNENEISLKRFDVIQHLPMPGMPGFADRTYPAGPDKMPQIKREEGGGTDGSI